VDSFFFFFFFFFFYLFFFFFFFFKTKTRVFVPPPPHVLVLALSDRDGPTVDRCDVIARDGRQHGLRVKRAERKAGDVWDRVRVGPVNDRAPRADGPAADADPPAVVPHPHQQRAAAERPGQRACMRRRNRALARFPAARRRLSLGLTAGVRKKKNKYTQNGKNHKTKPKQNNA
jgi:hypothetical protein